MQQEMVITQTPFFNQVMNPMQTVRLNSEDQFQVSYQESLVFTASREELILMLYDGALKFIRRALYAMDEKDQPTMNYNLLRAQKIVHYLNMSLDMEKGKEISFNLARLYEFINTRLSEGQIQKTPEQVREAMDILHTLRQAWHEAFMNTEQQKSGPTQ